MSLPQPKPPLSRAQRDLRFALRVAWLLAKGFALAAMLLVALAAGAAFVLPRVFDGEKVRGLIVAQAQRALQRNVEIDGLALTPRGIKLRGVRVYDAAPSAPPMIESDYALMTFKLKPLLEKRLELWQVRLSAPKIRLMRDESGRWNLTDLFVSSAAAPSQQKWELPLSLVAERISVENGAVEIEDHLRGQRFLVDKVNLSVEYFDVAKPFQFKLTCDDATRVGKSLVKAGLAAEGTMSLENLDWEKAFVRTDRFELKLDGRLFKGTGALRGFARPSLDAELSAPALGPDDWQAALGRPLQLSVPESKWRAVAKLEEPGFVRVSTLEAAAGSLNASFAGTIDWRAGPYIFEGDVAVGEFPLTEAAAWRPSLARFELKGTAQASASILANVERLIVKKADAKVRGLEALLAHAKVEKADLDVAAGEDFARLSVSAAKGTVYAFSQVFSDAHVVMRKAGRDLRFDRVSARWNGQPLRVRGRVTDFADPKQITVFGSLDRLRWEDATTLVGGLAAAVARSTPTAAAAPEERKPWVRTFKLVIPKRFPDTQGRVQVGQVAHKDFSFANADLLWDVRGVTPSLKYVNGEARVGFGPGRVGDIQAVQSYHKFLRIVFLPYIYMHKMNNLSVLSAATAYPKSLDFNRIEGQYEITRGVATTRFLHIDSPQVVAFADGKADFDRESVDMGILTRLTSYRAPLPQWWSDELGRPAIGFRVKGDLNQPELEPRLNKIGATEIERRAEEARARARTRFEKLEKLEAEGQPPAAPKAGSAIAKEAVR